MKRPRRGVSAPAQENVLITQSHMITQDPVSRNGGHPSLSTLPQLLERLDDARDDLRQLINNAAQVVDVADEALAFIDRRVEQARARERRRDRRNRRRKHA